MGVGSAEATDPQRYAAMYRRHVRTVHSYAWRRVGDAAADVVSETFLVAWRRMPELPDDEELPWLLGVARRVVADHIRSLRSRPRSHDGADTVDRVEPGFAEDVVLNELVGALDPERRAAFVLTQLLGLSYADAAEVCGCPVGTIRSRVARAREDLVTAIQDDRTGRRVS